MEFRSVMVVNQKSEEVVMKKLVMLVAMVLFSAVFFVENATAGKDSKDKVEDAKEAVSDASWDCDGAIEGKWNVQKAGDIKKHLKKRLKIEKTGKDRYSVKIKNDDGDTVFKSAKDFSLTCKDKPKSAKITGKVEMGNCMHNLEIGVPFKNPDTRKEEFDKIYVKITSDHEKGDCRGHKDSIHDKDTRTHSHVAHAKRAGK